MAVNSNPYGTEGNPVNVSDRLRGNEPRLKASWEVRAGIIPGQPLPVWTKRFFYTSAQREEDETKLNEPHHHAHFSRIRAEAMDYYLQASMPNLVNWAEITFIWY